MTEHVQNHGYRAVCTDVVGRERALVLHPLAGGEVGVHLPPGEWVTLAPIGIQALYEALREACKGSRGIVVSPPGVSAVGV